MITKSFSFFREKLSFAPLLQLTPAREPGGYLNDPLSNLLIPHKGFVGNKYCRYVPCQLWKDAVDIVQYPSHPSPLDGQRSWTAKSRCGKLQCNGPQHAGSFHGRDLSVL